MCHEKLNRKWLSKDAILLLGIYLKKCKQAYSRETCISMFIAALSMIAKLWNQLGAQNWWLDKEIGKDTHTRAHTHTHTHTNWVSFGNKEGWKYVICRKMDRTRNHHAMSNKPDWERQLSLSSTWRFYI
jgi:hypothetical protein